jgi:hypothetical protein
MLSEIISLEDVTLQGIAHGARVPSDRKTLIGLIIAAFDRFPDLVSQLVRAVPRKSMSRVIVSVLHSLPPKHFEAFCSAFSSQIGVLVKSKLFKPPEFDSRTFSTFLSRAMRVPANRDNLSLNRQLLPIVLSQPHWDVVVSCLNPLAFSFSDIRILCEHFGDLKHEIRTPALDLKYQLEKLHFPAGSPGEAAVRERAPVSEIPPPPGIPFSAQICIARFIRCGSIPKECLKKVPRKYIGNVARSIFPFISRENEKNFCFIFAPYICVFVELGLFLDPQFHPRTFVLLVSFAMKNPTNSNDQSLTQNLLPIVLSKPERYPAFSYLNLGALFLADLEVLHRHFEHFLGDTFHNVFLKLKNLLEDFCASRIHWTDQLIKGCEPAVPVVNEPQRSCTDQPAVSLDKPVWGKDGVGTPVTPSIPGPIAPFVDYGFIGSLEGLNPVET